MKKIGFIHQPNDPYVMVRIEYFLSKGYDVYSIVFEKNNQIQKKLKNLKILVLKKSFVSKIPFLKRLIFFIKISKITRKYKLDILHVVSALNSFYLYSSKSKVNVLELEGSDVLKAPFEYPFLKSYYNFFFKYAHGVIQDSKISQVNGILFGAKRENNEVIEIGVDINVFNNNIDKGMIRKKYNLKKNQPMVFHSRSLKKIYNILTIIKSIAIAKKKFNNIKFLFTGSYKDLQSDCKEIIENNNLKENIIFVGKVNHKKEMKYYYKDSNLSVSVPYSDSSPFSVYESMACKTPVIVSDLNWFKGKFKNKKHLLAVKADDYKKLGKYIIDILENNIKLDLESASMIIRRNINKDIENKRLENLYKKLLIK